MNISKCAHETAKTTKYMIQNYKKKNMWEKKKHFKSYQLQTLFLLIILLFSFPPFLSFSFFILLSSDLFLFRGVVKHPFILAPAPLKMDFVDPPLNKLSFRYSLKLRYAKCYNLAVHNLDVTPAKCIHEMPNRSQMIGIT